MDNLFKELEELTLNVLRDINNLDYVQLTEFVEQRDQIITQLQTSSFSITVKDKGTIANILRSDSVILARMKQIQDEASTALIKAGTARIQKNFYNATYTPESVFFDKKK